MTPPAAAVPANLGAPMGSGLSDLFDLTSGVGTLSGSYVAPKAVSTMPLLVARAERRWRLVRGLLTWPIPQTLLRPAGMAPGAAVSQHNAKGRWGLWEHREEILGQGKASQQGAGA